MTGQLPLAIAQLLLKYTPALRSTSTNDATAMVLVLHPHTNPSLALGNQQDPIFILGHIARCASRAFPLPILLFQLDAQLFERAGGLQRGVGFPGGEIRKLRSGTGGQR